MKRAIVIIAAVAAGLFVSANPSQAGSGDDRSEEQERSCKARHNSEGSCNRNGTDDCRDARAACSDDDLSPDVRDSEIYICAVPRSCPRDGAGEPNRGGGHGDGDDPKEQPDEEDGYTEAKPAPQP